MNKRIAKKIVKNYKKYSSSRVMQGMTLLAYTVDWLRIYLVGNKVRIPRLFFYLDNPKPYRKLRKHHK